jgi:hypothetical protein
MTRAAATKPGAINPFIIFPSEKLGAITGRTQK